MEWRGEETTDIKIQNLFLFKLLLLAFALYSLTRSSWREDHEQRVRRRRVAVSLQQTRSHASNNVDQQQAKIESKRANEYQRSSRYSSDGCAGSATGGGSSGQQQRCNGDGRQCSDFFCERSPSARRQESKECGRNEKEKSQTPGARSQEGQGAGTIGEDGGVELQLKSEPFSSSIRTQQNTVQPK